MARYQLVIVQRTELGETEAASYEEAEVMARARWHGMSEADKARAGPVTTPVVYYVIGIEPRQNEARQGDGETKIRQSEVSRNDSDGETQSATKEGDNDA